MTNREPTKKASPLRRGFEYQDLTALRLALEKYIANEDFRIYLDYAKSGSMDDIVSVTETEVCAYQVKHAQNPFDCYEASDFYERTNKRVFFKKFADGWTDLCKQYPMHKVTCHLVSNRSIDKSIGSLLTSEGVFTSEFIDGRKRKEAGKFRKELKEAISLEEDEFKDFLRNFHFNLGTYSLDAIEVHIKASLLGHHLGLTDSRIYHDLLNQIRYFSQETHQPLTSDIFNQILRETERRFLLPQKFAVNTKTFVHIHELTKKIDKVIAEANGEYIVITGLPGSGKSTSLSMYLNTLENRSEYHLIRYYCFVSVHDNWQKARHEAETLRVNLLAEIHRNFSKVLSRRHEYSEDNFIKTLEYLGEQYTQAGKKLIIFLDGLDHVERDDDVMQSLLTSLPRSLPDGVVFLIGTQELKRWTPLALKKARSNRHISMPLFSIGETREYLIKQGYNLTEDQIKFIHNKSEGLPLYLDYVAALLKDRGENILISLPPAVHGEIETYYETLWEVFERSGYGKSRHLCAVIASLRFPVHSDELFHFQRDLNRPEYEESFQATKHLFRTENNQISIFHDSFRVFVLSQIRPDYKAEIIQSISENLKREEGSVRWFTHGLQYALSAKDYKYILKIITKEFVDDAMRSLRPDEEIMENIGYAVQAAHETNNLVAMARLGPLHYRTNERLEYNLEYSLLAKALLYLGRKQEVVGFSYNLKNNRWFVSDEVALDVISWCAEVGEHELGDSLLNILFESFRVEERTQKHTIVRIGNCMGAFGKNRGRNLRWLAQSEFHPDSLNKDVNEYAPGYEPQLAAYLNAVVKYRPIDFWKPLRKLKKLFDNKLVRYYLICSIAARKDRATLAEEINQYLSVFPDEKNLELASFSAQAGLPFSEVKRIAGTITIPPTKPSEYISSYDCRKALYRVMLSALVLAYESGAALKKFKDSLPSPDSFWGRIVRFAVITGKCAGLFYSDEKSDYVFNLACEALDELINARKVEGERIIETHDGIRELLPEALFRLTHYVSSACPQNLGDWTRRLISLRDSIIWTIHYGINESIQDYSFELTIWDRLSDIPKYRPYLYDILTNCYETYSTVSNIKGGSRSHHFLSLSAVAAKCGFHSEARSWIQRGIDATNIYGYHKDVTLSFLMDTLQILNLYQPENALSRCSDVLKMIKWMGSLTDGRETKWFPQQAFSLVLKANRSAAMDLIGHYSQYSGRWNMLDCLEEYISSIDSGDPMFLWALCELFAPHFSEPGRHPKQVIKARQHVVDLAIRQGESESEWKELMKNFIKASITPLCWPDELWQDSISREPRPNREEDGSSDPPQRSHEDSFILDNSEKPVEEIKNLCMSSFEIFRKVVEKLKIENQHFYRPSFVSEILYYYISNSDSSNKLLPIKEYIADKKLEYHSDIAKQLANKFIEFGDLKNGCDCLEMSYSNISSWRPYKTGKGILEKLVRYDDNRFRQFMLKKCYDVLQASYAGLDIPTHVAAALELLGDIDSLEQVFLDFLQHCKELFHHLPAENQYEWLKNYKQDHDENKQITLLLIDELSDPEVDLGHRLVRALATLASQRADYVWPIVLTKLSDCEDLKLDRLLSIIQAVSLKNPELIRQNWDVLWNLAENSHFRNQYLLIQVIERAFSNTQLPHLLKQKLDRIRFRNSRVYRVSNYCLLYTKPSSEFVKFFNKGALFDIKRQINGISDILKLDLNSILAGIERRLRSEGWDLKEAKEQREDDWYGNVHPQGWPVVWIIPRFHVQISKVLDEILSEFIENMAFQDWQNEALWRIVQPNDPEFIIEKIGSKPSNISPLVVEDKDNWFKILRKSNEVEISKFPTELEWVTLFEFQHLSHDEKYNVPYRKQTTTKSTLIAPEYSIGTNQIKEIAEWNQPIIYAHPKECLTWDQARRILTDNNSSSFATSMQSVPIISYKHNPSSFFGLPYIVSLPSFIIRESNMVFRGHDLYMDNQQITRIEYWQEGCQDECYSRELLSFGTRFSVHFEFMRQIIDRYNFHLCQRVSIVQAYFKSNHLQKPDDQISKSIYKLFLTN